MSPKKKMNKIIWLTGHSGSGKTTIAKALQKKINCIILDGDEMRHSISTDLSFSPYDRTTHNFRVAKLAYILSKQMDVVVSVIAPIKRTREFISNDYNPIWIYLKRKLPERKGHFYEPSEEYFSLDTDKLTVDECVNKIYEVVSRRKRKEK